MCAEIGEIEEKLHNKDDGTYWSRCSSTAHNRVVVVVVGVVGVGVGVVVRRGVGAGN